MKKTFIIMVVLLSLMLTFEKVSANSGLLDGVITDAKINNDGTVDIKQTWYYDDRNTHEGTEHYINMNAHYGQDNVQKGKETITDYRVSRNGEPMTYEDNWNIDDSFEQKAGKYGLLEVGPGEIELAFGITEKVENGYDLEYKVHNVVKETTDGHKYLHWTFVPTELYPNPSFLTANIAVEDGVEIDKIYGFNYDGEVGFMGEHRQLVYAEMDYGTYNPRTTLNVFVLLKDEDNLISNTYPVNMSLNDKAEEILKGSDYDLDHFYSEHYEPILSSEVSPPWWKNPKFMQFMPFFFFVFVGIAAKLFILFISWLANVNSRSLVLDMNKQEVKKLKKDKDFYYRDEPEEIAHATAALSQLGIVKNIDANLLSYFISKWTSKGVLEYLSQEESQFLFFKFNNITFKIHEKEFVPQSLIEEDLFDEIASLANKDGVMSSKDLSKIDMARMTKKVRKHKRESAYAILEEKGYIYDKRKSDVSLTKDKKTGVKFVFNKKPVLTESGQELMFAHAGLKNFLEQFTLLHERSTSEIKLWDHYFYLAAFYGIADKFKKELDNIPNLSEQNKQYYNRYYGSTGTALLSRTVGNSIKNSYRSHNSSSSSSGGGSGSSGGGSGGGTR